MRSEGYSTWSEYLCVFVSVCYHVFCHRAQQCAQQDIPAASVGHEQSFTQCLHLQPGPHFTFFLTHPHCLLLQAATLAHEQPRNSNPTRSLTASRFSSESQSHSSWSSTIYTLVMGSLAPHVGHPTCSKPMPPQSIPGGGQLIFELNSTPPCPSNKLKTLLMLLYMIYAIL